jgi:hypothetical protein
VKIVIQLPDENKRIELPDSECKTDDMLRAQLSPYYHGIAEADIRRDRAKGIISVDTVAGAFVQEDLDDLLEGKQLLVAFTWIPGLKGKVQVTVNATNLPAEAQRKLIAADQAPKMPADIIQMIADVIEKAQKAKPKAKAKAAGGKR